MFLFLQGVSAGVFDWGGQIENISQYSNIEKEVFTQGNRFLLWMRSEFSPYWNFYANAGYLYRYEEEEHKHIPDISTFHIYGTHETGDTSALDYSIGRIRLMDNTGRVLDSVADGISFLFDNRVMPVRLGVGYTGYVFNLTSEVAMSPADEFDSQNKALLAPPRFIQYLEIRYSNLPGGTTLRAAVVAQEDFRSDDFLIENVPGTGRLHTQYAQVGLDGRLSPDLFYVLSGVLQTGQYRIPEPGGSSRYLAGMVSASLDWYIEPAWKTVFSMEFLYSSGDNWEDRPEWEGNNPGDTDILHRFIPVSNSTKGCIYSPLIGNLIYCDLHLSVKPVRTLQIVLSGISFFRAVNGPISEADLGEENGDALYLGEELDLDFYWRPYSDLGLSLCMGIFLPNRHLMVDDTVKFRCGGYLSFSF